MYFLRRFQVLALLAVACSCGSARGLTIKIDYSTDASNFFGVGNPHGAAAGTQAKAALDAAAAFYSGIMEDTLSSIVTPTFSGSLGGSVTWFWQRLFPNPATGFSDVANNMPVAANEYVVFVGARNLGSSTLGVGGPGSWSIPVPGQSGSFTPAEVVQIQQMHEQFINSVSTRGETSGFARWGGALTFDVDAEWNFNHTTAVPVGKSDLYTVALHELAHTFGFGASLEWSNKVSGTNFIGAEAMSIYHAQGPVPLASAADTAHWSLVNTGSTVYDGDGSQQPVMSASIPTGQRRFLTDLDAAGLVDIGWEIDLPELAPGDYNRNGVVDAGDYAVWRDSVGSTTDLRANGDNTGASANKIDQADYEFWRSHFGALASGGGSAAIGVPEPASAALLIWAVLAVSGRSRRARR